MSGRPLLVFLAVAAFVLAPVAAHDPDLSASGEGPGNPPGLAGIQFIGPAFTEIEDKPCDPIADEDRSTYADPASGHIGHINGVMDGTGDFTNNWIESGSIDLYHFEIQNYENPRAIEGMHPVTDATLSVMMGSDGYFRAKMMTPLADVPGPDMVVQDVHDRRTYCIYGAQVKEGPYFFMNSTYMDPTPSFQSVVDFSGAYAPLYRAYYPGQPVQATWILFITSAYIDSPVLNVDFAYSHSDDPANLTWSDVNFVEGAYGDGPGSSYEWDFGDGSTGFGPTPAHKYAKPGTYLVCLKVKANTGLTGSACHPVTVRNRPPIADFSCFYATEDGLVNFLKASQDWDGKVVSNHWKFGDGTEATTSSASHMYPRSGTYNVTYTVRDDFGAEGSVTKPCETVIPNRPPYLEAMPLQLVRLGEQVRLQVVGHDPDGDNITFTSAGIPGWAKFDATTQLLTAKPLEVGRFEGLRVRVSDPFGLWAEGGVTIYVFDQTTDLDQDGVQDVADVCPSVPDPDQADSDGDGRGDACQPREATTATPASGSQALMFEDIDGDYAADRSDNCRDRFNPRQEDADQDLVGDACDGDIDGDGVPNWGPAGALLDNCPLVANQNQEALVEGGPGEACDPALKGQADGSAGLSALSGLGAAGALAPGDAGATGAQAPAAAGAATAGRLGVPIVLAVLGAAALAVALVVLVTRRAPPRP